MLIIPPGQLRNLAAPPTGRPSPANDDVGTAGGETRSAVRRLSLARAAARGRVRPDVHRRRNGPPAVPRAVRIGLGAGLDRSHGPVSRRSTAVRDTSLWLLESSPHIRTGIELSEQPHRLLAILEPVTAALWELVEAGYQANWFGYVASHAAEHAAQLDRPILQRLLVLPGDLWFDISGDNT